MVMTGFVDELTVQLEVNVCSIRKHKVVGKEKGKRLFHT